MDIRKWPSKSSTAGMAAAPKSYSKIRRLARNVALRMLNSAAHLSLSLPGFADAAPCAFPCLSELPRSLPAVVVRLPVGADLVIQRSLASLQHVCDLAPRLVFDLQCFFQQLSFNAPDQFGER